MRRRLEVGSKTGLRVVELGGGLRRTAGGRGRNDGDLRYRLGGVPEGGLEYEGND